MFGNLLNLAASVIPMQQIEVLRFEKRVLVDGGRYENTYGEPEPVRASVQSVDRRTYKELGLDMSRNYMMVYASDYIPSTKRDAAPDLVIYDGRTFEVVGDTAWTTQDGWTSGYIVEISH